MIIIGIGHKSRQGKDTLGKFLVKQFINDDYYAKTYAFADSLKAYCRVAFGMQEKDGALLQYVGTEIFRKKDYNFWINQLFLKLEEDQPEVAIITDMRFLNEANFIKDLEGHTIKVVRYNKDGSAFFDETRSMLHQSEIELDNYNFDYVFTNDLSKDNTYQYDTKLKLYLNIKKNYL